ncbi:RNA polymerase sigma factor [Massilia niastensis]|uniref:RNA polymerase sigma factor n=1 Tax=Massilia niastensis TaxID=544911 RepID=UPI00039DFD0D|nr:sigma-70 family RNA polymerase sigma factor [Massilia niastensis]
MALSEQYLPVLDAAHKGDPAALEQLLRLCQPDIRRYAQRSCLISDVDDAVQEALLVLSRRLEAVRLLAAFSGWLFKVVQRECRRLGRRALQYDPYDEERAEQWLASHDNAGLRVELVNALDSLPRDYLEIILLRDFEERSIAEIAEELGLTPAAAKSRLHRARAMAREYLIG